MGEAKRKRDTAKTAKEQKQGVASLLVFLALILVIIAPVAIVWKVTGKKPVEAVAQKSAEVEPPEPRKRASVTKTMPARKVIDTAEGFIQLAKGLDRSEFHQERQQALVYWKGAAAKDPSLLEAWQGYARCAVKLLLEKDATQPMRPLPVSLMHEARHACSQFVRRDPKNPLGYELSAYTEALFGNQEGALMHATNADFRAAKAGLARKGGELMTRIITISSRRKNSQDMGQPHIPGMPVPPVIPR